MNKKQQLIYENAKKFMIETIELINNNQSGIYLFKSKIEEINYYLEKIENNIIYISTENKFEDDIRNYLINDLKLNYIEGTEVFEFKEFKRNSFILKSKIKKLEIL